MGRKKLQIKTIYPKTTPLQAYYYRFKTKAQQEHRIFIWPTFKHFEADMQKLRQTQLNTSDSNLYQDEYKRLEAKQNALLDPTPKQTQAVSKGTQLLRKPYQSPQIRQTYRLHHMKNTDYNTNTIFWTLAKQKQSNQYQMMRRQANAKGLPLEWRSEAEFLRAFPPQPSKNHRLTRTDKKKGFTASNLHWKEKLLTTKIPKHKPCQDPTYPSFSLRKTS